MNSEDQPIFTPSPQAIHVSLVNSFFLPRECRDTLAAYYVLHWQGSYLRNKIDPIHHTIIHADVEYIPIWKDPLHSGNIMNQFKLSFRKSKPMYRTGLDDICYDTTLPNYVLIKVKD